MLHAAIINFRRRIVNRTRGFSCRAAAQFNPGLEVLRWDSGGGKEGGMVGLLRGPAGARSQRPARHPRLGHRPDWPTQPRPEGLGRPVRIFLRPPQGYFLGNSVVLAWNGGLWW